MSDIGGGPSIYPFQGIMLICNGCGGERHVPDHEVASILSAPDLTRFTSGPMMLYACKCGREPRTCDIRIRMSQAAEEWDKSRKDGAR